MLGEILALASSLIGATSTILSAKALAKIDPVRANAIKTIFAAILMLPIAYAAGELNSPSSISVQGVFLVILGGVIGHVAGDTILFKSIATTDISRAYTLSYSYPLFTMIIAVSFLDESFSLWYLTGTVLTVLAVIMVMTEKDKNNARISLRNLSMAIITALLWAVGTSIMTMGLKSLSVLLAQALRFPALAVFLLFLSEPWKKWDVDKQGVIMLLLSGVLGMILAGFTFLSSVQLIGASKATPLNASSPIWASVMSAFVLKEKVTPRLLLSAVLVVVGVFFFTM